MIITKRLQELIRPGRNEALLMPGVHDALSALLAQQAGFEAVCLGGYGASASMLGRPDVSLLTATEMADHIRRITDRLSIPVFVDGDTGHGGLPGVQRTVKTFEKAGAAGLFIEDQVFPKRCGHMAGKAVVDREEATARILAAVDARTDENFVIMGRTDAIATHGLGEALVRAQLYAEAGADMIFVEAPTDETMLGRIGKEVAKLGVANFAVYLEGGVIPQLDAAKFAALGFNVVCFGCSTVYAAAHAMQELFSHMRTGNTRGCEERMVRFSEFNELLGLQNLRKKESELAQKATGMVQKTTK